MTGEQAGGITLPNDHSGVLVASSSSASLITQTSLGLLTSSSGGGPVMVTFNVLGDGEFMVANGLTVAFAIPFNVGFNPGELRLQDLPATAAVAAPESFLLAPLTTETPNAYARNSTNGLSGPGAGTNASNLATSVGIGNVIFTPSGGTKVSGDAGNYPAMDRTLTLAGGGLSKPALFRDTLEPGSLFAVAATEPDSRGTVEQAGLIGLTVSSPQRFELMMNFMPFDSASVGQTIDQFLERLDDVGVGLSWLKVPTDVVVELLAVGVGLTAWKAVPGLLGRCSDDEELAAVDVATSLDGISGLPGGSSLEEP